MKQFIELSLPEVKAGSVWLVGAGPGKAALLTLLAYHAIQTCDIIIHDALISEEILNLIPQKTERLVMGKRGGMRSVAQDKITQTLIDLAKQNKKIVRLKGGDPFVFGRSMDEIIPLAKENIDVQIVPGVSAGIAGSAFAGVPLSDGNTNQIFSFISAHDATGQLTELDWNALIKNNATCVFYMPMKHIDEIATNLRDAGYPMKDEICFISNATLKTQRTLFTTLEKYREDLDRSEISSPALLIIGKTVKFHPYLEGRMT